jgi:dipeptidyl aminopeptidase/acylaminoacyl peptidase
LDSGTRYTPEMAVDLLISGDIQVSPDGNHVAFTVSPIGHAETNPTAAIFYSGTDSSLPAEALTDRAHNNTSPRWSPDSRSLAFLSDRVKRGTQQLYVSTPDSLEPFCVTELAGGVASPAWMPCGQSLIVSAQRNDLAGTARAETEIVVASERSRPRGLGMVARHGGPTTPVGPPGCHIWCYAISPDGKRLATFTSPDDQLSDSYNNVHLRIGPVSGQDDLVVGPFAGSVDRVIWSPDGGQIAFIASKLPEARNGCVWLADTLNGELTQVEENGLTQSWVGYNDGSLLVVSVDSQRTRLDAVSPDGKHWEQIELPEEIRDSWLRALSASDDGDTLACIAEPDVAPGDAYAIRNGTTIRRLSNMNPHLERVELTHLEELTWQSPDGTSIDGWLLRPPGASEAGSLPLVVYVHGGPSYQWGNWFHGTWHDWAHNLAARGFAVLLPNPRGSTGKGGAFTGANQADLGGRDFEDIMAGVDFLIDNGVADSSRLGIGGWSYGGFIVAWAIGKTDRFKAAVAGAAVTNWVSKVGTTDIRQQNESNFSGQLHQSPDEIWERSPIRYLGNMKTPTLIVHGEADPRVPVSQSMELYLGLKAVGVDTEFVSYPRQKHAFHERAFQLDLLQRTCDWFERYLK